MCRDARCGHVRRCAEIGWGGERLELTASRWPVWKLQLRCLLRQQPPNDGHRKRGRGHPAANTKADDFVWKLLLVRGERNNARIGGGSGCMYFSPPHPLRFCGLTPRYSPARLSCMTWTTSKIISRNNLPWAYYLERFNIYNLENINVSTCVHALIKGHWFCMRFILN